MNETTYIIQSSELRYDAWTPWSCVSPQYSTLRDARRQYAKMRSCRYFPGRVRLVRVTTTWQQIPGVRCSYNAGSRLLVIASKRLRCYLNLKQRELLCPPTTTQPKA
jgi:hypothetical protein